MMKSDFDFGEDYSKQRNKNKYSKKKQAKKLDRQKNSHPKKTKFEYEDYDEDYSSRRNKKK